MTRPAAGRAVSAALDHVQLAAPPGSEADARRFYGRLLGLPELEKPEPLRDRGGVWFALGVGQLHIGIEQSFSAARRAHPGIRVADLETLRGLASRLETAGVRVRWDDALAGTSRFYTEDPWGNRLELLTVAEPPPSRELPG